MTAADYHIDVTIRQAIELADGLVFGYMKNLKWRDSLDRHGGDTAAPEAALAVVLDTVDVLPDFAREHFDGALAREIDWQNFDAAVDRRAA